ncbi:hypothetical protein pb186bvf_012227 [Paramecium bursaria]
MTKNTLIALSINKSTQVLITQQQKDFCTVTQHLLCQECIMKSSFKPSNVLSIEKALQNIATYNKGQIVKLSKVIKQYNQLDQQLLRDIQNIGNLVELQVKQLNFVQQSLLQTIQNKFQEILDHIEIHKIQYMQQINDQKIIVEEYQQRAYNLEKSLLNFSKTSGFELLRKFRDIQTINSKTIKELENEMDNLQQQGRIKYSPYSIKISSDIIGIINQQLSSLEIDSRYRINQKFQSGISPNPKKALTQHTSPAHYMKQQSFLKKPLQTNLSLKTKQTEKTTSQFMQDGALNDISSITDRQCISPEHSIKIDIDYLNYKENIKESINESMLSGFSLDIKQKFYVIGGTIKGNNQNIIEQIDLNQNNVIQHDFMISSRSSFFLGYKDNNILIIGGKQDKVRTALCEEYNPITKELKLSQLILTKGVNSFSAVQLDDKIYISGGKTDRGILDNFQVINLNTMQIKSLAQIPQKCCRHSITYSNDKQFIYLVDERYCFKYDIKQNTWSKFRQPMYQRQHHKILTLPDGIWLFGGQQGRQFIKYVERFDEIEQQWQIMGELKIPVIKFDAIVSKDLQYVYIVGGKNQEAISNIQMYNVLNNQCVTHGQLYRARYNHRLIKC